MKFSHVLLVILPASRCVSAPTSTDSAVGVDELNTRSIYKDRRHVVSSEPSTILARADNTNGTLACR
jgi:hypothetical protein